MSRREKILNCLKKAAPDTSNSGLATLEFRDIFNDYPQSASELSARFQQRFVALKGEFFRANEVRAAAANLQDLVHSAGEDPIAAQPKPLVDEVLGYFSELQGRLEGAAVLEGDSLRACEKIPSRLRAPLNMSDCVAGPPISGHVELATLPAIGTPAPCQARPEASSLRSGIFLQALSLSSCVVGISVADHLVARTGSIVIYSSLSGGRRLSVLPPFHVFLARSSQLVFSLEDALSSIEEDQGSSYFGIINGPSRTADIEKILVMGAHGPKLIAVILVESYYYIYITQVGFWCVDI